MTSSVLTVLANRDGLRYVLPVTSVDGWTVEVDAASAARVEYASIIGWSGANSGKLVEVVGVDQDGVEEAGLRLRLQRLREHGVEKFLHTAGIGEVGNLVAKRNRRDSTAYPAQVTVQGQPVCEK